MDVIVIRLKGGLILMAHLKNSCLLSLFSPALLLSVFSLLPLTILIFRSVALALPSSEALRRQACMSKL